ncbi:MAG TPA: DEAD/DEAH box helicase, partial [Thermoplasmatales archaeon]|nr:DEAD/DEAH box helicase [Thermoplasmatales archaeon]
MYVEHKLIKPNSVEYREYQVSIARVAAEKSTLVVLPTGLGKTVIALLVIAEKLKEKKGKILFLAPTKPLVLQHTSFLREHLVLSEEEIIFFTGEVSPKKRAEFWEKGTIIVSTPQVVENDIISRRIDLSNVCLIIFDEAHRAVGEYSYVFVADQYKKQCDQRLTLGITASPGSDIERILEVCKNLGISNIEIRTKYDRDVKPYVHEMDIVWKKIDVPPEFAQIIQLLKKALSVRLKALKDARVIESASLSTINRKKLLDAQVKIQNALKSGGSKALFMLATVQNEALKIYHAIELLQTQGTNALKGFFQRLQNEAKSKGGSRASKRIMNDPLVSEALAYLKTLSIEHPKIQHVIDVVQDQFQKKPDSRVIVFTHYRDTALQVEEALKGKKFVKPVRFIGQAARGEEKGLSQKKQAEILEKFREGVFNTLIATSVAEEGIDIPSTDMVVFYEPIPSEIRTIQRRGRTARQRAGRVVILIAKNTPDEGYYWSSLGKEKRMRRELEHLRNEIKRRINQGCVSPQPTMQRQMRLIDFQNERRQDERFSVIVDHREYRSQVVRRLTEHGMHVKPEQLP